VIEVNEQPAWPTTLRARLQDGRLQGIDGSVWMYRAVPLAPVSDARSPEESLLAAEPVLAMFEELAGQASATSKRRQMAKGSYRDVHLLLVNVPQRFEPDRNSPLAEYLRQQFPGTAIDRRVLLFGVRLRDKIGSGGWRQAIDSVVDTIMVGGTALADFDDDTVKMNAAMDRSGLVPLSGDEVRLANAWWNHGHYADTPMLVHPDHVHIFDSSESVSMADKAGLNDCPSWTRESVPGTHAVTFTSVMDLELDFVDPKSAHAHWASDLIDAGAFAISIRGRVEPGVITREELRRQRKKFIDDINERHRQGKMDRAEQNEMLGLLEGVEGLYGSGGTPPPTLASCSIVVGFDGQYRDVTSILPQGAPAKLAMMEYRQNGAMAETWLCSPKRANPHLHDLPVQVVAASGLPSLSFVGDRDGALAGFSERDRQPSYLSPTAASSGDAAPLMLVPGQTGSGKTQFMQWVATQFARSGRPTIILDPKMGSDLSPVVEAVGGQIASLDRLLTADGIFDPLRFSATAEVGVELATSMLMSINVWGTRREDMEVPLQYALAYGVSKGANCTGQALAIAERDLGDTLPDTLVSAVRNMSESSPMFRACVGWDPNSPGLRVSEGLTLIKVGDAHLDLPDPGIPLHTLGINQRITTVLVRMMVFGSAMSLAGRDGVLCADEAWVILGAGKAEVERLGRLARSQRVLPILFTQRVTDALKAGLTGYISRGFILPMEDPEEARAACELFRLDPTEERLGRLMAKATKGGNSANAVTPNWYSMRALRDPVTDEVIRGSIGLYVDLSGRAVPVEVTLPPSFLKDSTTNADDLRRREEEKRAAAEALAAQQQAVAEEPVLDSILG
jgi:hypothetical protein